MAESVATIDVPLLITLGDDSFCASRRFLLGVCRK
jgi:hypothetical protein